MKELDEIIELACAAGEPQLTVAAKMLFNARCERDEARDECRETVKRLADVQQLEWQLREAKMERDFYRRMLRELHLRVEQMVQSQGSQVLPWIEPSGQD